MHPTEAYFPTVAGVIATLVVALVFGWQRPRQRGLGRFGIAYAFSLFVLVPLALTLASDGMTKKPAFPEAFSFFLTEGVVVMLLLALIVAFAKRGEE